ncbi:MAG TPA: flagellar basal body L-ring protein FlgH [Tepidisphaeraceae bacterium]|jgi:flagellar L-ring protein precursor FlgH|nr:flagellar basal body L-ring protein FlgH [Tepidisphaeraceae bacterium]
MILRTVLLTIIFAPVALAQRIPPPATMPAQPGVERPSPAELMQLNGGSLLKATLAAAPDPSKARIASISFFSVPDPEPKVIKKHDLVTIIIREESEMSTDGKSDLKKNSDLDARLDEWVKFNFKNFALQGGGEGAIPPAIKMSGARNFKGEAKLERTDSFLARITAEVVDVKPNGTFAIQARKLIKKDEEEQEFILTGICRGADVTPDNTVLSSQVYNLALNTQHKGAVRDTTKRGFIPKLLDFINPF